MSNVVMSEVRITKGPEKNHGVLVTESDLFRMAWVEGINGKAFEIGRGRLDLDRMDSRESIYMPYEEYEAHLKKANAAFSSRRKRKAQKRAEQARLIP